jgi:hypothetical protein
MTIKAKTMIEATMAPAATPTPAASASEYDLEQLMLT